jgi:hypothetical protein
MVLTEIVTVEEVLHAHADVIGADFVGYRNHAYRVANLCLALSRDQPNRVEKIAIAAAFHDIGIWTAGTFDYLQPSIAEATAYLARAGRDGWTTEISAMIREHHKISRYRSESASLVEPFRRADWTDVTMGLTAFGSSRTLVRHLFSAWPSAGFHKRLVQLSLERWRTHPLSPLPMIRL